MSHNGRAPIFPEVHSNGAPLARTSTPIGRRAAMMIRFGSYAPFEWAIRGGGAVSGAEPSLSRAERLFALDILRGVAVSLVLVRHIPTRPSADEPILGFLFEMGWTGVDLFFVLSGFLISGLLFQEVQRTGAIRFKRFWLRRGMKIWPAYFAIYGALAASRALLDLWRGDPIDPGILSNLIFIQNYFPHEVRWPHSWSLAIEEHFYIFLPLLMAALVTRGALRRLPLVAAALCAGVLALRCALAASPGATWSDFYYPTHLRADSLMFGVILGYVYHFHPGLLLRVGRAWPALLLLAAFALAAAAVYPLTEYAAMYTVGFTFLYVAFGGAVVVAAAYPSAGARNPVARAVAWMGVYSYTIYLCHSVVMRFPGADHVPLLIRRHLIDSPWVDRILFWVLSVAAGYVTSRLIERPFLALRSRWLPVSRSGLAPAPAPASRAEGAGPEVSPTGNAGSEG